MALTLKRAVGLSPGRGEGSCPIFHRMSDKSVGPTGRIVGPTLLSDIFEETMVGL
jgi:hypothetical protein